MKIEYFSIYICIFYTYSRKPTFPEMFHSLDTIGLQNKYNTYVALGAIFFDIEICSLTDPQEL